MVVGMSSGVCKSKFRLQSKYVFLTFPKCSTRKETALERLKTRFEDRLEWAVVCSELHKDGTPHLHVVCAHTDRFDAKTADYWDFVGGQHGNYQPARNLTKSLSYVTKDGLYTAYNIDPVEFVRLRRGSGGSKFCAIASRLRMGASIASTNEENCGFVLQNLRKLKEYVSFLEETQIGQTESSKSRVLTISGVSNSSDATIAAWMCENLFTKRSLGQRNLWIVGPTDVGKTRMKEALQMLYRVYEPGYDGEWFDQYKDGRYDLVVFDEFKGQYKPTMMNRWLGSEFTTLRRRGTAPIMKRERLPCIVLSNYDIRGCYKNLAPETFSLVAMDRRVEVVSVTTVAPINLVFD